MDTGYVLIFSHPFTIGSLLTTISSKMSIFLKGTSLNGYITVTLPNILLVQTNYFTFG